MSQFIERFATVGTFDGVHLGHRLVLNDLKMFAMQTGTRPTAFVMKNHPLTLVRPADAPKELTGFEEKRALIEKEGVEVIPIEFTEQVRSESSAEFMRRIRDEYGVKGVLVGYDNRFGCDRDSTFEDYRREGLSLGIRVEEAPEIPGISSTAVRRLISQGKMWEAYEMLGRYYNLTGTVVHGAHLGHRIGFPTANLQPEYPNRLLPAPGVYKTYVRIEGEWEGFLGVTNIGRRPTVEKSPDSSVSIETHIIDESGDFYGRRMELLFVGRLRGEERFPSLEALKEQIARDIEAVCKSEEFEF